MTENFKASEFDTYSNWDTSQTGTERIRSTYQRPEQLSTNTPMTREDARNLTATLEQNVIAPARENPDIQFYCFFTPYSIFYMDEQNRYGTLQLQFEGCLLATMLLLEYENIHLYSFFTDCETILDPNCYTHIAHYDAEVNSLLQRMAAGEYLLTKDNYQAHRQEVTEYYSAFDYDALFA